MLEAIGLFVTFALQIKCNLCRNIWQGPVVQWIE
jgi:hypothetical protein